jgi:hypothetical protein
MPRRATSLNDNSSIAVAREIDSKYDVVKAVAGKLPEIEIVSGMDVSNIVAIVTDFQTVQVPLAVASAATATTKADEAVISANIAVTKAAEASASATLASAFEVSATASALSATGSATSANTSASTSTTKAGEASSSAVSAAASAFAASNSELSAGVSEDTASAAALSATASEIITVTKAAEASASAAIAITQANLATAAYDSFDDRYLGVKTVDPLLDNDNMPLLIGALYWNTTISKMMVWDGIVWESILSTDSISTLTNKTIDDMTNIVGADHIHYKVRNASGTTITIGTVVAAMGTQPGTDYIQIVPVTNPQTQIAIGVTHTELLNNEVGLCVSRGVFESANTSAWVVGTILYPNTVGGFTTVKPAVGIYQACAYVLRQHSSSGTLLVNFIEPRNMASTTMAGEVLLNNALTSTSTEQALTAAQGKVLQDTKQPQDATLTALSGITTAADKYVYATGIDTFTTGTITIFGRSLVDDIDNAAARTTLGISATNTPSTAIGGVNATNVQAAIAELDSEKLAISTYTAADVLAKLLTVDGTSSLLDADTVDGMEPDAFPVSTATQSALDTKVDENLAIVAGTNTKITYDAKGLVIAGTILAAVDIPGLDASKITTGTIDTARLPSYVDDILEYANLATFPVTGEAGKIYIALDTNKTYRWSGTVYVYITSGAVDSVNGATGIVVLNATNISSSIYGTISATNVQAALQELDSEKVPLNSDFTLDLGGLI